MAQEWKLKNLTKLDLKNNDKVEAEVEGIEGGKVLLVKTKDQIHALNANCTHFGAPLKNGVLTPEGRLTCPWHGACFNVATGDVEDAPAPHALNKFDVVEKNGGVYIKGQEKDIKGGSRKVNIKTTPQSDDKVVIVGSGSGAFGALLKLRENNYKGKITVVSPKGYPIDRTKLSKALITDESKLYLNPPEWYKDGSIDFVNDAVSSIDFPSSTVKTTSGSSLNYNKLILATGGTPNQLPLPGFKDGLSNIFVLRDVDNVQNIMSAVGADKKKNIVVVGTSFIGMEVGNALAKENNVTLVGMEDAPLERVMGKRVGGIFQKMLEKNGAKFYMGASVDSAVASSDDKNKVAAVKLKDGTELPADLVILGIGVKPATAYLHDNKQIQLEKDGSVKVDEHFRVNGLENVWAIGDIATYPYKGPGAEASGSAVRIEHWNVAQNMGRSVGAQIAAGSTDPGDKGRDLAQFIPTFWSALGSQLRYCGNTPTGYDDVVIQGQPDEAKFAAFYAKGDTVVAVATMGMDPVMVQSAELMRKGSMLGKADLEGGKDVLKVALA
jgi:NADPH-dependent 2,4-dienoyl-CoA reductase/sulfur reductase-like enzyme/nitrite reductase/ring-hydroxylating ferredoxin subunit